jgi:PKD repeat protein
MRALLAATVTAAALIGAAPASGIAPYFAFPNNDLSYKWSDDNANHAALAPAAQFAFQSPMGITFQDHPLVWDTGELAGDSSATNFHSYIAPTQPGFYAFHCSIHGTAGTEGSVGSGMAGYVVVGTDQHATPDFSISNATPQAGTEVTFSYTGTADPDSGDAITRYLWDLNGDGSFETSTTSPSATNTYQHPGGVNVSLKVIDKGHEFSGVASHSLTVQAGPGGGPNVDVTPPRISFGARITEVRHGRLRVKFRSNEAGAARAVLKRGKKTFGRGHTKLIVPGPHVLVLKLNGSGLRALRRHPRGLRTRLTLTVLDAAGNAQRANRTLRVREAA